ncbi:MAG TPA: hypothetical protein VFF69_12785, partial [Phycisphaerales bacterium]|nr:hypothetical protein [Phycisphaerales bacterium]
MHSHPRSVACGLALGLALAWGLGTARQPVQDADALPDDPMLRELALLRDGLFAEQSRLPLDPEQSIEQMLGAQGAAIARLEARVAAGAPAGLDVLERRVAELEGAIGARGAADAGSLVRELQDLRRSIADLDRRVENVPE